jgi:NADP-dependent 3-hydroxy acid dehydrogenase YdfG
LGSHIKDQQVIDGWSKAPPMEFMQPKDIADVILFVVTRAHRVNMNNILLRPVEQSQ